MDADEEDMHEVRPFLARLRLDVVWFLVRNVGVGVEAGLLPHSVLFSLFCWAVGALSGSRGAGDCVKISRQHGVVNLRGR